MLIRSRHGFALAAVVLGVAGVPAAASAAHHVTVHAPRRAAAPQRLTLQGLAKRVDTVAGTVVISVSGGSGRGAAALVGTNVTVSAAGARVQIAGQGRTVTMANINVGDRILAFVLAGPGSALVANRLVDSGPPPPPPPLRRRAGYWAFNGTVAGVNTGTGTVLVTIGQVLGAPLTYVGQQLQFTTSSTTRVRVVGVIGGSVSNLADVAGGDSVGVYVVAPRTAPAPGASLAAVDVSDFGHPSTSTTTSTTTSSSTTTPTSTTTTTTSTSTPTSTTTTTTSTSTPTSTATTTTSTSTTSRVGLS